MLRGIFLGAICACDISLASAQSLLDKARRDEVAKVRTDDAAMAAAMQKARNELGAFLSLADAPPADTRNFSVKVGLPVSEGHNEYVWIRPFTRDGEKFVGTLVNTPRNFTNLAYGDRLAFARKDIVDWSYLKGGRTIGNYTACALLRNDTPQQREAFRKQYGIDCMD